MLYNLFVYIVTIFLIIIFATTSREIPAHINKKLIWILNLSVLQIIPLQILKINVDINYSP